MQCKFCINKLPTKTIKLIQSQLADNFPFGRYIPKANNCDMSRRMASSLETSNSWSILKDILSRDLSNYKSYSCFLLNICNHDSYKYFDRFRYIWDQAALRIAVDGSVNCLDERKILHMAHIVCGDFDSANGDLIELLRNQNNNDYKQQSNLNNVPQVIETPCQQETDFTKALGIVTNIKPDLQTIIALYYADGKRMDHLFGLINTLHRSKHRIIVINIRSSTVSWILRPGEHLIQKPPGREICSLIPFIGPAQVTTEGLKYNLKFDDLIAFGCTISTSNQCLDDFDNVSVKTSQTLLWSIDLSIDDSTKVKPELN